MADLNTGDPENMLFERLTMHQLEQPGKLDVNKTWEGKHIIHTSNTICLLSCPLDWAVPLTCSCYLRTIPRTEWWNIPEASDSCAAYQGSSSSWKTMGTSETCREFVLIWKLEFCAGWPDSKQQAAPWLLTLHCFSQAKWIWALGPGMQQQHLSSAGQYQF